MDRNGMCSPQQTWGNRWETPSKPVIQLLSSHRIMDQWWTVIDQWITFSGPISSGQSRQETLQNKPIQRNSLLRCIFFVGCLFPFVVFWGYNAVPPSYCQDEEEMFSTVPILVGDNHMSSPKHAASKKNEQKAPSLTTVQDTLHIFLQAYHQGIHLARHAWWVHGDVWLCWTSQNVGMFPRVEQWHFCDKDKSEKNMQELITIQGHNRRCSQGYGSHGPLA